MTRIADAPRAQEVRERIMLAARDLLAAQGLDGVSMRGVAEQVGVTATALYHYFDNKDALVRDVVESGFREFTRYLQDAAQAHPSDSLERLRALGEAYIRFALDHQAYFRVLFSTRRPRPQAIEELPEGGGYELFRQALVHAMEAGTIRRTNPDLLAMYLWCVVHGLVTISLTCGFEEKAECAPPGIPGNPIELFHALGPFVRDGIRAPASWAAAGDGGDQS